VPRPAAGAGMTQTLAPETTARPRRELDEQLVCTEIIDVTHDVKSFVLATTDDMGAGEVGLAFDPGQYLTVTVTVDGEEVQRCYTIASPPTRPGPVTITVQRVPGGPVSNWLHDHLRVGEVIRAAGPHGQFSLANHPASKYLFLSAGSGITPLMS